MIILSSTICKTRKRRDLGRISSINPQALFLDKQSSRVHQQRLRTVGALHAGDGSAGNFSGLLAHDLNYQTGWHSVFYDVAPVA